MFDKDYINESFIRSFEYLDDFLINFKSYNLLWFSTRTLIETVWVRFWFCYATFVYINDNLVNWNLKKNIYKMLRRRLSSVYIIFKYSLN